MFARGHHATDPHSRQSDFGAYFGGSGKLLREAHTDNRRVWVFRHQSVAQAVRQRYLPSAGDIKLANEALVELMSSVPSSEDENDPVTSNLMFPQPINKDNGAVNWRRVRYHWYYLLHAGKQNSAKNRQQYWWYEGGGETLWYGGPVRQYGTASTFWSALL